MRLQLLMGAMVNQWVPWLINWYLCAMGVINFASMHLRIVAARGVFVGGAEAVAPVASKVVA